MRVGITVPVYIEEVPSFDVLFTIGDDVLSIANVSSGKTVVRPLKPAKDGYRTYSESITISSDITKNVVLQKLAVGALIGDVNRDGTVNGGDANLIKRVVGGTYEP